MPVNLYTRRILLSALCLSLLLAGRVSGQHDPYEVLLNGIAETDTDIIPLQTSEELFLDPLSGEGSLFGDITGYGFSMVRYSRRGAGSGSHPVDLFGADLSGNLNSGAPYGIWSALGRSRLSQRGEGDERRITGLSPGWMGKPYDLEPDVVPDRISVGVFTTDRKGRLGLKAGASGTAGGKWVYMADVYRRWGRDGSVKGVFTERSAYFSAVSGLFGRAHRITLFSAGEEREEGHRSYVTREVIDLAGDNRYNPSWGYQAGKQRNSRVYGGLAPVTGVNYEGEIGNRFSLAATLAYRGGKEYVSGLTWLDAATPYPDYYRYLPSYASTETAARLITEKWRAADATVTGIDWNNLYRVNSDNVQTAVYTLSDRVEKIRDLQAVVSGSFRVDDATTVGLSLSGRRDNVRRYRRMKDLLGGLATEDIDQYLYGDEIYGDRVANNIREPNRKVNEGDAFGYDYDIFATRAEGIFHAGYRSGPVNISGSAGFAYTAFRRRGNFEKELYPGELSYGRSAKTSYETYHGEFQLRYAISPTHTFSGHLYGGRAPQQWATHFITPTYSNAATPGTGPVTTLSGEAGYAFRGRTLRASASVYYTSVKGRNSLYNYWDDISSTYSAMVLRGAASVSQGVEIAADYDVHPRWNIASALALGSYKYSNDPDVDIYSENTLEAYVSGATAYLKGYHGGLSPESIFTTKVSYNGRGVSAGLAFNYAGGRYAVPSPLRRMQRAFNLALNDGARDEFTGQEKLGDAFTVDLTLLKSFRIGSGHLSLFLAVSNLLNDRDIVYGAYEQMRVVRRGSGVNANWTPFGNKYLYSYGRTYYFSVTWSF